MYYRVMKREKKRYIGLMSGTSMDGVDAVLCEVDAKECKRLFAHEHPFPQSLKEKILDLIAGRCSLAEVGAVDHHLGGLFAQAVNTLLEKAAVDPQSIAAIGSHGQTVWHEPSGDTPFSIQLGDPNIIAAQTGIAVVADFRRKDMAYGGQGAPFAPAFHRFLLGEETKGVCVVNIGGIANITVLGEQLTGYDTGPGNMLMDLWIAKHKGLPYDKDGNWAREGRVDYGLLEAMMDDEYFKKPYPKSTGREKFNEAWLWSVQRSAFSAQKKEKALQSNANQNSYLLPPTSSLNPVDIQCTLLELTAQSIANEVLTFNPDMLMLCGGGARNGLLVERIAALMPNVQVGVMEEAEHLEAMMMAWLAYKRMHNEPVTLKDVTGAQSNTILGGVYR